MKMHAADECVRMRMAINERTFFPMVKVWKGFRVPRRDDSDIHQRVFQKVYDMQWDVERAVDRNVGWGGYDADQH